VQFAARPPQSAAAADFLGYCPKVSDLRHG
jgi:hypothetical protein